MLRSMQGVQVVVGVFAQCTDRCSIKPKESQLFVGRVMTVHKWCIGKVHKYHIKYKWLQTHLPVLQSLAGRRQGFMKFNFATTTLKQRDIFQCSNMGNCIATHSSTCLNGPKKMTKRWPCSAFYTLTLFGEEDPRLYSAILYEGGFAYVGPETATKYISIPTLIQFWMACAFYRTAFIGEQKQTCLFKFLIHL